MGQGLLKDERANNHGVVKLAFTIFLVTSVAICAYVVHLGRVYTDTSTSPSTGAVRTR